MASPVARDTHLCVNGGIGEFTITAVSVSNSSNQQQLALGTAGLSSTGTVGDVATLSTVTDVLATVFSLSNGNTNAIGSDYSLVGISSGFDNDVNGKMAFTDPSDGVPSAPGNYCVSPADPTTPGYGVWSDFLTLNGVSNFALCEGIEDRVISNPQNSSFVQSAINFTTCFEVFIFLLPVDEYSRARSHPRSVNRHCEPQTDSVFWNNALYMIILHTMSCYYYYYYCKGSLQ